MLAGPAGSDGGDSKLESHFSLAGPGGGFNIKCAPAFFRNAPQTTCCSKLCKQFGKVLDPMDGAVRPGSHECFEYLPEGSEAFGVVEDDFSSFGQVLVDEIQDFGFA